MPYGPFIDNIDKPEMTQKQGFWDKFKQINSGDRVLGMKPDEFGMLFGRLANAIAPNTVAGRMGQAVAEQATYNNQVRLKQEEPERVMAQMRLDELRDLTKPQQPVQVATPQKTSNLDNLLTFQPQPGEYRPTSDMFAAPNVVSPVMASAAMAPTGPAMTFSEALGRTAEQALPPSELEYRKAMTTHVGENTKQLQLLQERMAKLMPSELRSAEAGATTAESGARVATGTEGAQISTAQANAAITGSGARVAEATEQAKIDAAKAELNKLQQEGALLAKENQYYKETHVDLPRAGIGVQYAGLKLRAQELQETMLLRRQTLLTNTNDKFSALSSAIEQNGIKQLDKAYMPKDKAAVYQNTGKSLINEGLAYYNQSGHLADVDESGGRKLLLSGSIATGLSYMVEGINTASNIGDKINLTHTLINELDNLRAKGQGQVADAYESALFAGTGPLAEAKDSKWLRKDEVYNPAAVYKAYRSRR